MPVDAPAVTLESRTFEAKARTQSPSRANTATLRAGPPIRQVALVVDPAQLRLAHYELTRRLAAESGACVTTIRGRSVARIGARG
jgi:hypothetical protein